MAEDKETSKAFNADCLECRVVGTTTFVTVGAYYVCSCELRHDTGPGAFLLYERSRATTPRQKGFLLSLSAGLRMAVTV